MIDSWVVVCRIDYRGDSIIQVIQRQGFSIQVETIRSGEQTRHSQCIANMVQTETTSCEQVMLRSHVVGCSGKRLTLLHEHPEESGYVSKQGCERPFVGASRLASSGDRSFAQRFEEDETSIARQQYCERRSP